MRWKSIHLVFAVAVLVPLGVLAVATLRTIATGTEQGAGNEGPTGDRRPQTQGASSLQPPTSSLGSSPAPRPSDPAPSSPPAAHYRCRVVQSYPHDRQSFTQGLVYENGILYEGTGLYGQSALFQRDLPTGKVLKTLRLPDQYFGEGIALVGDRLFQLTWQSGIGFIYRKDTFTPLGRFRYRGEGWGLAYDGKRLILSDGTATLRFLDPNTCAEIGRLEVHDQGRPVAHLNELEFVAGASPVAQPPPAVESGESPPNTGQKAGGGSVETGGASSLQSTTSGLLYANIWPTDRIAIIDPATGRVTAWINLSGLYTPPPEDEGEAVPNGIAWLPQTRHLLVTGKLWPQTYEIELIPR